jgi:hypothetical protein
MIKNRWADLINEIELCRENFDEEEWNDGTENGFYGVVCACDGEIQLSENFRKNFATQVLYGVMDADEYDQLRDPDEYEIIVERLIERLNN